MTDSAASRKSAGPRRSADSAEAILGAAEALLAEKGYAGFSIEAVAKRAQAGKTTVYRWWPSRAALILDVYHRQKRDVSYPDSGDLERDLTAFLKSLIKVWRETPAGDVFRSLIAEAQSDAQAGEALAAYARDRREQIADMVRAAQARGDARADADPVTVAELVASFAWVRLLTGRLGAPDTELRQAVATVLRGVRPGA